jgi:hypothetical protein
MLISTSVQSFNSKFLIFKAPKNDKISHILMFESLHCSLLHTSDILFLDSQYYKVFRVEILHVCRSQYCPYLELISDFLENLKYIFWILKKSATCSSSYICSFRLSWGLNLKHWGLIPYWTMRKLTQPKSTNCWKILDYIYIYIYIYMFKHA